MNYFSHAAVATLWPMSTPGFVLGAMLPDLAGLTGASLVECKLKEVEEGVAFHIRTDASFHKLELFQGWHGRALHSMRLEGVGKGPARAAAHVGVEMLIDDALARDPTARSGYCEALRFGRDSAREIEGLDPTELEQVCSTLLRFSEHLASTEEERLHVRLSRTLARRPRLAANDIELSAIVRILTSLRDEVSASVHLLVTELLRDLSAEPSSQTRWAAPDSAP